MATFTYVGSGAVRIDAGEKVTGKRLYTVDVHVPRMVHAKILRSPLAHAFIKRLDTARAVAYPGVAAVITGRDIPGMRDEAGARNEATIAVEEVLYYGQPVAAVLAEDPQVAEEALDLIEVEYEPLPAVIDPEAAIRPGTPLARRSLGEADRSEDAVHHAETPQAQERGLQAGSNISQRVIYQRGDVEKAFAAADVVVERTWRAAMTHQGYMEPQAAVADYTAAGDVTVWCSTQGPFPQREAVARVLGIPESRVNFEPVEMGGGFGGKNNAFQAVMTAVLSRAVRRPVKYVLSRSEDLKAANPSPQVVIHLKTGATRAGKLTAIKAQVILDCGAYPGGPMTSTCNSVGGFYDVPNYDIEGLEVMTNKVSVGALRAPGQPQGAFAIECQMDLMAKELGIDPLQFRINNAAVDKTVPPLGRAWGPMYYKQLLERLQQSDLWQSRSGLQPNQGIGVAGGGRLSGANRGNAMVLINRDGTATVAVGQQDITGIHTAYQQITAEELGIPIEQVRVYNGGTRTSPYAGNSGGSTSLRSTGRAVQAAAVDARRQLLQLASRALEANPDDLEIHNGVVTVKGSPDRKVTVGALTLATTEFGMPYPTIIGKGNTAGGARVPTFSVVAVKVEVDPETGGVTLLDALCVQDVGQAINSNLVEGQIQGGVFQALAMGYSEEMQWDEHGVLRNPTLLDYRIPVALDLPRLRAETMNFGEALNELYGAKGVGEPPIIAGAAALANAVRDAVGAEVHEMPVTAERILRSLNTV